MLIHLLITINLALQPDTPMDIDILSEKITPTLLQSATEVDGIEKILNKFKASGKVKGLVKKRKNFKMQEM